MIRTDIKTNPTLTCGMCLKVFNSKKERNSHSLTCVDIKF